MKDIVQKYLKIPGPSGYESEIRNSIQQEVQPYADDIQIDSLGNLIVKKGSKSETGKRIMLAAHIDEIGVMVTHIDENGFARFTNIGGVSPRYALSGHVRFLNGTLGVIGMENMDDPNKVPKLSQMFIDVGATSRENCPLQIGDVGVFERSFIDLGDRIVSKAMDDRISVAVLIETIRRIKRSPHEIYFVFTVQEEVGLRGATTAAYQVNPDVGIAVDVTRTGDTPRGIKMEVSLGKGPAIKVRDSSMLADPRVVEWMRKTAQDNHIPYQLEVLERGGTDARAIQLTRSGVPAGCLSIPCRYVHSPSEMVDINDVENAVKLLLALLQNPVKNL